MLVTLLVIGLGKGVGEGAGRRSMGLYEKGEHLLVAGAGDGEISGLLLCCHEPGGEGTDETEERSQGRGDGVLLAPH